MLRKLVRGVYRWIRPVKQNWPHLVEKLQNYKPKMYHHSVVWQRPRRDRVKCNTDGASKGNLGDSSFGFCIRNLIMQRQNELEW
uniref:Putative ovule protein n=1 Tax=Solanum chacoense TaxID=4108 RepID=A0A0V0HK02_SOLCH